MRGTIAGSVVALALLAGCGDAETTTTTSTTTTSTTTTSTTTTSTTAAPPDISDEWWQEGGRYTAARAVARDGNMTFFDDNNLTNAQIDELLNSVCAVADEASSEAEYFQMMQIAVVGTAVAVEDLAVMSGIAFHSWCPRNSWLAQ